MISMPKEFKHRVVFPNGYVAKTEINESSITGYAVCVYDDNGQPFRSFVWKPDDDRNSPWRVLSENYRNSALAPIAKYL
jgi:hypothetical protein